VSRAFVKETDATDVLQRPEPVLPAGAQNHVTPWGAAAFLSRLADAQAERAALDDGPMAQARKAELDAEIRWLERRMATFVETPPAPDPQRVGFGAVVTLEGERGARTITIVGVDEVDPGNGAVSWTSPLAMALRGAAVGDVVTVRTPGGEEEWEITGLRAGP
jgi:transcription elongation factor GreB